MPIQAIETRRLYVQIADQLRQLIQNGEFAVGSKMPAERELAAQLGVSRPSVREALIALEVEGLVEVRMGSGIFVIRSERIQILDNTPGPLEIIRARQLIEGELAAMAAGSNDNIQLVQDLEAAIQDMEGDIAANIMPIKGDRRFHIRIAHECNNETLSRIAAQLFDERNSPLFARMGNFFEYRESWIEAVEEHRSVLAAIANHDKDNARRAMHYHFEQSHKRYSAQW